MEPDPRIYTEYAGFSMPRAHSSKQWGAVWVEVWLRKAEVEIDAHVVQSSYRSFFGLPLPVEASCSGTKRINKTPGKFDIHQTGPTIGLSWLCKI